MEDMQTVTQTDKQTKGSGISKYYSPVISILDRWVVCKHIMFHGLISLSLFVSSFSELLLRYWPGYSQ